MKLRLVMLSLLSLLTSVVAEAQNDHPIRLSGIILMLDSLKPVPNSHIFISSSRLGTRADEFGMFALEVQKSDTIIFTSVGYKSTSYIVPDTLKGTSYSIIQRMPHDTIILRTIDVFNWPTIEQFNEAFTKEHGYDKKLMVGQHNANPNLMNTRLDLREMDAHDNFRLEGMRYGNRYSYIYENAHIPVNNVLNPTNWDKLFKNWSSGSRSGH